MTDFVTPFNQFSDYQTPLSDFETAKGINESTNNNKDNDLPKVIYKTPPNNTVCFLSITSFVLGLIPTCIIIFISIYMKNPTLIFISFFAILISTIGFFLGSYFSMYFIISIDANAGIVVIKSKKPFCCFNKTTKIEINNIQSVSVETDKSVTYNSNTTIYYSFKVIFRLFDKREIKGCSGTIDKNNSGRIAFDTIRKALPQNIPVYLNLETNNNNLYSF